MALFSQERRHLRIGTLLGKDVLHLQSLQGTEGMSRLFRFELSLVSENQSVSFEKIIGTGATVSIDLPWGKKRFLNGIISGFTQVSGGGTSLGDTRTSEYRATLVPWLWLLTRSAESRIHQNLSVPEIVEKVLKAQGFSDFEMKLQGSYPKREYCVQYRETHFDFLSRLLEEEGIHYFFRHSDGRHRLVLADAPEANLPCPGQETANYQVRPPGEQDEDVISSLEVRQEISAGRYTLSDFNFELPNLSLLADIPSRIRLGPGEREVYDHPGRYGSKAEGDRLARVRMEEKETEVTTLSGSGNCRAFCSGHRFKLCNFHRTEMCGKDFLLTSIVHDAAQEVHSGGSFRYANRFTCIPAEIPFRPPRVTPRPVVPGSQTAIVVGPAGEELYVDRHGRVKVQFHWDREGKKDDKSSCWIRVGQLWAGANWGAMFLPRVGQEVIVDFLEGDPDRPIVTGRVYNAINHPPYALPAEKTRSGIRSSSSGGGGGCNEIRFEDRKGSEQLFIHAEKRQDVRVKQDSLEWVGGARHLVVGTDQMEKVGGDKHLTVSGDLNERVGGTVSLTALNVEQKIGVKQAVDAGQEIHLKAGMKVVIEAGTQITLKVGGHFLSVGSGGVTVDGSLITSGGSAGSGSGASPETPKLPKEADRADVAGTSKTGPPAKTETAGPQAAALRSAAENGAPFCDT